MFRIGTWLLRILSYPLAAFIARSLGTLSYALIGSRRRILHTNIAHILPAASPDERARVARRTYRNFALMWMDVLRLPILGAQGVRDMVRWEGKDAFDAVLAQGRGVLVLLTHVGACDLAGAYLAARGYPVTAVAEDIDPPLFEILRQYRCVTGMRVVSRREAVSAYRVLRRGEVLLFAADRLIGGPGMAVEFFDAVRMIPTGPAAFALHARAPVTIAHMVRERPSTTTAETTGLAPYRLVIEELQMSNRSVPDVTQAISRAFVRIVQQYPDQWYVFQPDWIEADAARLAPLQALANPSAPLRHRR